MTETIDLPSAFPAATRVVPEMLRRQAQHHGARQLFVCGEDTWSFADAPDIAARCAGALKSAGIGVGDRVALLCNNRSEFLELFLGCAWLGAVSVPINTAARGFQLQHILNVSGSRLIAVERELLPALEGIDLLSAGVRTIWIIDHALDVADVPRFDGITVASWPRKGTPIEPAKLQPHDLLTILFTSGTTGPSKGVCCPHAQYFWWAFYTGRQLGVMEGDVLHTTLPLFHTNALNCFFQALLHGGTQVVERRFSVSQFWSRLVASGATVTYVLGAMVPMLLSRPHSEDEKRHRVRVALAPGVPEHFHEVFTERSGILLLDGYGATESNAVIGTTVDTLRPGRMGRLADGFEARVVDEEDNPLPDGEAGELLLRANEPFAMAAGYFGMPEKTVEAWRNLWLHTGDRVIRDSQGYFKFVDRMKDTIRRRGENVSSFEVEQVLSSHPAVEVAAVFPVPSDLAEDEVMAAIVLKQGGKVDPADLVRFCEGKLSYFAIPRFIEFLDGLPRTESGKIQKFKLREQGRSSATWDLVKAGIELKR
ncbi:MAG: ATP-dependent acyl-CoA ligase [Rhizobiales bacterium 62-17]|nr:MAG: ATP-dependent acyl-CoA ligase [Rhizobiales bacterium 62-17]